MDHEVEAVAKAFYEVSGYQEPWDQASPRIQARMREDARTAIRSLDDYRGTHLVDDFLVALQSNGPAMASGWMH
ncbi:MAG: hypothetical protein ABW026_03505 [Microvirga sp.]